MQEKIQELQKEIKSYTVANADELDAYKRRFTNKKGIINELFAEFRGLDPELKRSVGKPLNELKTLANDRLTDFQKVIARQARTADQPHDLFLPGDPHSPGARHPLSIILKKIVNVFERIGFIVADGPEIEDDWHNFSALNFPPNHPAREMQDTFFIQRDPDYLLRTHTSNVQIRTMEKENPPIRVLAPGRVYRNEAISARAHCFFPSG